MSKISFKIEHCEVCEEILNEEDYTIVPGFDNDEMTVGYLCHNCGHEMRYD